MNIVIKKTNLLNCLEKILKKNKFRWKKMKFKKFNIKCNNYYKELNKMLKMYYNLRA